MRARDPGLSPPRRTGLLWRPALLIAGLLAAGLAWRLVPGGNAILARLAAGRAGGAGFLLAGALAAASGVPRQAVAFAAGFGFGVWRGVLWALAAQMLGCAANFFWARALAGSGLRRRLAAGRGRHLAGRLLAAPFRATLMLRLMPVGNNCALNLAAGAVDLAAAPFLAASLLGYLPQTVIFVLLGGGVAIGARARLALALGLFAAAAGLGLALWRVRPSPIEDGGDAGRRGFPPA